MMIKKYNKIKIMMMMVMIVTMMMMVTMMMVTMMTTMVTMMMWHRCWAATCEARWRPRSRAVCPSWTTTWSRGWPARSRSARATRSTSSRTRCTPASSVPLPCPGTCPRWKNSSTPWVTSVCVCAAIVLCPLHSPLLTVFVDFLQCVRSVWVCGCVGGVWVCDEGCLPLGSLGVTVPCGSPYCLVVCCTARQALVLCWRFALYKCFIIIIIIIIIIVIIVVVQANTD